MKSKKRREMEEQKARSKPMCRAMLDFLNGKPTKAECPDCKSAISVAALSDTEWSTKCDCGKCSDTFRELRAE